MTRGSFAFIALAFALCTGCAHGGSQSAATMASAAPTFGNESRGAEVFRTNCAICHATNGAAGGVGPPLAGEKTRRTYGQIIAAIEQPDPPMPKLYPSPLSEKDVDDVAAFVQTL